MHSLADELPLFHSGKVRDTYWIPLFRRRLAVLASDRLSTHNVRHLSEVPGKGEILTALTVFWLDILGLPTHMVAWGRRSYDYLPNAEYDSRLHYRTIIVHQRTPHLREFIYRRFLTGTLEKAYRAGEDPYELALPEGLPTMAEFSSSIFTPTEKSNIDDPVSTQQVHELCSRAVSLTWRAFERMEAYLAGRGITLIDGKFEACEEMLLDEWGTGDCCRMAFTSDIREGESPPWLDKEYFRKAAERQWAGGEQVPLHFDRADIESGVGRYHDAFEAIVGTSLAEFQRQYLD